MIIKHLLCFSLKVKLDDLKRGLINIFNDKILLVKILSFFLIIQVQISSLCMCVTVSATVALCLLFGPKMYVVLLHPEKCARKNIF